MGVAVGLGVTVKVGAVVGLGVAMGPGVIVELGVRVGDAAGSRVGVACPARPQAANKREATVRPPSLSAVRKRSLRLKVCCDTD